MDKSIEELSRETREIWNTNAAWWDERIGAEGNRFHREYIGPATERLLDMKPGESVLDIACGNGQFARRMAELGANVVAFDFSERFIERARAHTAEHAGRIEYLVMDATDEVALLSLGEGRFDAAVATMALMDMPSIEPLLRALPRLLKSQGRFVFSVTHPCFNHTGVNRIVEEEVRDGEIVMTYALKIVNYDDDKPKKGIGIIGQPEPHYYFDRTLQGLLGACFRAGLVMDGIEELRVEGTNDMEKPFAWSNFPIPNGMVARMRHRS